MEPKLVRTEDGNIGKFFGPDEEPGWPGADTLDRLVHLWNSTPEGMEMAWVEARVQRDGLLEAAKPLVLAVEEVKRSMAEGAVPEPSDKSVATFWRDLYNETHAAMSKEIAELKATIDHLKSRREVLEHQLREATQITQATTASRWRQAFDCALTQLRECRAELAQADSWGKACAAELERVKGERDKALESAKYYHDRGPAGLENRGDTERELTDQELDNLAKHLAGPDDAPLVEVSLVQEWIGELDSDADARHLLSKLLDYMLDGSGPIAPTYAITDKDDPDNPF